MLTGSEDELPGSLPIGRRGGYDTTTRLLCFLKGCSMTVKQMEYKFVQLKAMIDARQAELADWKAQQKELKARLAQAKQVSKKK